MNSHLQILFHIITHNWFIDVIFCNSMFFITHTYRPVLRSCVAIHIYLISCLILIFYPYLSSLLHDTRRNTSREKTVPNIKYVALQDVICQHLIGNEEVTSVGGRNIQVLLPTCKKHRLQCTSGFIFFMLSLPTWEVPRKMSADKYEETFVRTDVV